jgi:phage-related protein
VAKFAEAVFVLRCFEKTSQRTSRLDIDPATRRYRELVMELKG